MKDTKELYSIVGEDNEGIKDIEHLQKLSELYEYDKWLVFDATVVRGLSYYTGIVFECFDRKVIIYIYVS
jgi:histidyl-tRNA synthetase